MKRKLVSFNAERERAVLMIHRAIRRLHRHPWALDEDRKRAVTAACILAGMDRPATWEKQP